MLLDVAKESTDAFPPSPTRLGCISALVKHYEVRFHQIAEQKFLAWLEVPSGPGDIGAAVVALEKLMPWLREVRSSVFHCIDWC